eukprot:jgi/Psemu1/37926/gm1.37926_g
MPLNLATSTLQRFPHKHRHLYLSSRGKDPTETNIHEPTNDSPLPHSVLNQGHPPIFPAMNRHPFEYDIDSLHPLSIRILLFIIYSLTPTPSYGLTLDFILDLIHLSTKSPVRIPRFPMVDQTFNNDV